MLTYYYFFSWKAVMPQDIANCGDTLDYYDKNLGDYGAGLLAGHLKTNTTITNLDLGRAYINASGAKELAEALKVNRTIRSLSLNDNKIGNEGAESLKEMLKINSTLLNLEINNNEIKEELYNEILDMISVNIIKHLIDLKEPFINISNKHVGNKGAAVLGGMLKISSTITSIDISSNSITEVGAKSILDGLTENKSVTQIDISKNNIESATANNIYDMISRNYIRNNSGTLLSREVLDLSDRKLGDESAAALSDLLAHASEVKVRDLILRGNYLTDLGATKIASSLGGAARTVAHLDLSSNNLTAIGLQHLSLILESSGLTDLRLADIPSLGKNSGSSDDVVDSAIPSIAAALGGLPERLTALDLSNTSLACVPALCASLRRSKTIQRLTLQHNPTALADPAAAAALADLVRECPSLAQLGLARTGLTAAGAGELAAALPAAKGLARLDLSGNEGIGDGGAAAIAEALAAQSSVLRAVKLSGCGIGADGARALTTMAESNRTLCSLDLSGNALNNDVTEKIDDLLGKNLSKKISAGNVGWKNDVIIHEQNCAEAFAELCDALCANDGGAKKALQAYFAEVDEKVGALGCGTAAGMPHDEALALALLVSGGYFAEKLGAYMTSYMTSSIYDIGAAAPRSHRLLPPEARNFLRFVEAGLAKIAVSEKSGDYVSAVTLAFCEKVDASEKKNAETMKKKESDAASALRVGRVLGFGKFVVALGGCGESESDPTLDVSRMEGKTLFRVRAPLAKEVTEFVVLGGRRKENQKVFVLSPNALFVVVDQAKAELVEITSGRNRW